MVDAHGPQRLWLCAGLAEDTNREGGAALLPPARQCAFLDLRGGPCRIARGTCARAGRLAHRADHLARSVGAPPAPRRVRLGLAHARRQARRDERNPALYSDEDRRQETRHDLPPITTITYLVPG